MTPEGQARLISHEGERLSAYQDSEGWWTIGIGHLIDARKGGAIPQRISRMLFEDDTNIATVRARMHFDWFDGLDPVRQDVIVNLVFNMGVGGVEQFKLMIAAIQRHDLHEAAFQLANSKWGRQVHVERKTDLCNALEKGRWA